MSITYEITIDCRVLSRPCLGTLAATSMLLRFVLEITTCFIYAHVNCKSDIGLVVKTRGKLYAQPRCLGFSLSLENSPLFID
jgi:hypothetical protein